MSWRQTLGKDTEGSRPRCVLLTDGSRPQVAGRLTQLGKEAGVTVSTDDHWQPRGTRDTREAQLDKVLRGGRQFLDESQRQQLKDWWLVNKKETARTPTWDLASTCNIFGRKGLLLVEAKAHVNELKTRDECGASGANRDQIERAVQCANAGLSDVTGGTWHLGIESHYQLSNRFAWSWKIASLGVPVALMYLGFLNAQEMPEPRFHCESDWQLALQDRAQGVVDEACWDRRLEVAGTPLVPLVRVADVPFDP